MLEARLSAAAVAGSARAPDATAPSTAGVGCLRRAAAVDALVRGAIVEKSLRGEQTARSWPRELCAAPQAASPAASRRQLRGAVPTGPGWAAAGEGGGMGRGRGRRLDPAERAFPGQGTDWDEKTESRYSPRGRAGVHRRAWKAHAPRPSGVDSVVSLKRTLYSKARGCRHYLLGENAEGEKERRRAKEEGKVEGGSGEEKRRRRWDSSCPGARHGL